MLECVSHFLFMALCSIHTELHYFFFSSPTGPQTVKAPLSAIFFIELLCSVPQIQYQCVCVMPLHTACVSLCTVRRDTGAAL